MGVLQSKMLLKQSDPTVLDKKVNIKPNNYAELNRLSEDFGKRFVPQQELSDEQAFRLQTSHPNTDQSASSPVKTKAPRELPKIFKLVSEYNKVLPDWMLLFNNIVNIIVNSSLDINTSVNVNSSAALNDSVNYVEICNKCLDLEAELIKQHNMVEKDEYNRLSESFSKLEQHCISFELAIQLNKEIFQKNNTSGNQIEPSFYQLFELNNLKAELQSKDTTIEKLKANIKHLNKTSTINRVSRSTKSSRSKSTDNTKNDRILQISSSTQKKNKVEDHSRIVKSCLNKPNYVVEPSGNANVQHSKLNTNSELMCVKCNSSMFDARHELCFLEFVSDSGCSKHMTEDRSQLTNFVHKFLSTVKFDNDQIAKIMGYGEYQIGNITILRVYYVKGLGHNLFFVGQFCILNLEVAFRKHTCFVRNLEGVDLLSGSRETNLYTLSIGDMMASSPICLLFFGFSKPLKDQNRGYGIAIVH
ncbi:hypothetical protein Tco_0798525 [Tanacetum coccineum]